MQNNIMTILWYTNNNFCTAYFLIYGGNCFVVIHRVHIAVFALIKIYAKAHADNIKCHVLHIMFNGMYGMVS